MTNRHQSTSGEGGTPGVEGSATRMAFPRFLDRVLTDGAPAGAHARCLTNIGRAGRPGHISL